MSDHSRESVATPLLIVDLQHGPVAGESFTPWPADCGAEDVFLGRTRAETHPQFGPLQWLEYEVYEPMARKVLAAMGNDAIARFGCHGVRIVHALGRVDPGCASVVIEVATPHRSEAFAACRYLIDRIKHELPIWKREIWANGETFVEGCCAHHPADDGHVADPNHTQHEAR